MKRINSLMALAMAAAFAAIAVPGQSQAKPLCADKLGQAEAVALAKACQSRVEITGLRDGYKQIFANPDGSQTLETYAFPQRVRKDGVWQDIDTKLQRTKDGGLEPKAGAEVSFSDGGDGPFVVATMEGKRFELSWPGPLGKPKVDGSTATYPDVLPGVDLAVEATREGYNHVLVVKTAEAAASPALASVRYRVSGDVTMRNTASGSIELIDAAGKTMPFGSHASMMWDSAMDPALGGEVLAGVKPDFSRLAKSTISGASELSHSKPVQARAEGTHLVVTPDAGLLKTGTLPLFIDPPYEPWKSGWAYANNTNSNWTPGEHARVGNNPDDGKIFRSFFNFPVSELRGTQITYTAMNINLDHSAACAGNTAYAYRTSGIGNPNGTRVGWSPSMDVQVSSAWGQSNEAGGCGADQGDDYLVFGGDTFKNDMQAVANAWWTDMTIGLCMCANESGTYQWMKFHHTTAKLVTTYNRPPGTPTELSTSDQACGLTVATTSPILKARLQDPDGGERWLNSTFEWKELPSGGVNSVVNAQAPPGNFVSTTLGLGGASEGKSYSWRLITSDGLHPTQGVSGWCDFTVNAGPPPLPVVSSTAFPPGATPGGSPGTPGVFIFDRGGDTGRDLTKYWYGWSTPPTNFVTVNPGASASVTLTPPRHGYNTLYVYSEEPSHIASPIKNYSFLTSSPSAPVAYWPLDSIAGHGLKDQVSQTDLTLSGAVTWLPDAKLIGTDSLHFEPVSSASSAVSSFDTSGSFSVAARVRLSSTSCSGNSTAVSIDDSHVSGFFLSYECATGKWRMRVPDKNLASPSVAEAAAAPTATGRWTYLVGAWDEPDQKLRLYVNGVLGQEITPSAAWLASRGTGWKATGSVVIGRDRANDTNGGGFKGEVADVRLWNRVVSLQDLTGTPLDAAQGTQAVPGLLNPTEVGTWDFNSYDTLDGSYWSRHMSTYGNATFGDPGHDGNGSLLVDGAGSYAATSGPVVRTDQSFTVDAWVKAAQLTDTEQVILGQAAGSSSTFKLLLEGASDKWWFTVGTPSSSGGTNWAAAKSDAVAAVNTWVHLTGIFDTATGQTRLLVNGTPQATRGNGSLGTASTTGLFAGTNASGTNGFNGEIDEVKVLSGVNDIQPTGTISGFVGTASPASGSPQAGAQVQICVTGGHCVFLARADSTGAYQAAGLAPGTYDITAYPTGSLAAGPISATSVSLAGAQSVTRDLVLPALSAPAAGTTITPSLSGGAVPVTHWGDALTLTTAACSGGTGSWDIKQGSTVLRNGSLAVAGTAYTASAAALSANAGYLKANMSITCPDTSVQTRSFDFYSNPSGQVVDGGGAPVTGATVTLLRADAPDSAFSVVASGSDIMTPANRANTFTTITNGRFGWDTVSGYYKVRAAKAGCTATGGGAYAETATLNVQPRPASLQLTLQCGPTNHAPNITASPVTVEGNVTGGFTGTLTGVTATDPDGDTVTLTNNAPTLIPLGNNNVTWTAKDPSNATNTAVQAVTVRDTTAPSITCPANISGTSTAPALGTPTSSDIVDSSVTVSSNSPGTFPVGTTSVTWTSRDDSFNASTCIQQVTVTTATQGPYTFTGFFRGSTNVGNATTCTTSVDIPDCTFLNLGFELKDTSGNYVTSLSAITSIAWTTGTGTVGPITYDSATNKFRFNATATFATGFPKLTVTLADGSFKGLKVTVTYDGGGGGCPAC